MSRAKKYYINGKVLNPVFNGVEMSTELMSEGAETGTLIVAFYNIAGVPVSPTTGTIDHYGQVADGQVMGPSSGDVVIDATKCKVAPVKSTYVVPVYNGHIDKGFIKFTGISANAFQFSAYFWRT